MSKQEDAEKGFSIMGELLGEETAAAARANFNAGGFGTGLADFGARNVFAEHWDRPGLDRRARSLLTLGILIAGCHSREIRYHVRVAIKNGITVTEIEEMIYHASAYAGFPAASQAADAAREELQAMKLI